MASKTSDDFTRITIIITALLCNVISKLIAWIRRKMLNATHLRTYFRSDVMWIIINSAIYFKPHPIDADIHHLHDIFCNEYSFDCVAASPVIPQPTQENHYFTFLEQKSVFKWFAVFVVVVVVVFRIWNYESMEFLGLNYVPYNEVSPDDKSSWNMKIK